MNNSFLEEIRLLSRPHSKTCMLCHKTIPKFGKKHLNKASHQLISIEEFCEYTGLKLEQIMRCIIG